MAVWLIEPFHAQRQRSVGNTLRRARWRWVRLCFYTCLWIHWGREWRSEVDICKTKIKIWTLSHTLFLHLLQLSAPLLELVKTAEPTGMCVSLPCAVWLYYSNMRTNFFFQKALLFSPLGTSHNSSRRLSYLIQWRVFLSTPCDGQSPGARGLYLFELLLTFLYLSRPLISSAALHLQNTEIPGGVMSTGSPFTSVSFDLVVNERAGKYVPDCFIVSPCVQSVWLKLVSLSQKVVAPECTAALTQFLVPDGKTSFIRVCFVHVMSLWVLGSHLFSVYANIM